MAIEKSPVLSLSPALDKGECITLDQVWEELEKYVSYGNQKSVSPDEFTREQFQAKFELTFNMAYKKLQSLQKAGKISKRRVGKQVYYRLEQQK